MLSIKTVLPFSLAFAVNVSSIAAAESFYTLETQLSQDSNVGLAVENEHVKDDTILDVYADYSLLQELSTSKRLTYTGSLESRSYADYPELDHIEFGAKLSYQQKLGIGEDVPSFFLSADVKRRECEFEVRDSWLYRASAGVQKNLGERWFGSVDLSYHKQDADTNTTLSQPGPGPSPGPGMGLPNNAFDLSNIELGLNTEYAISNVHYLNLGYMYRDGEIASLGRSDEDVFLFATAASQALEFAGKDPNAASDLFMYRIDAKSHVFNIGWDYILNDRSSLGLNYQWQQTEGSGDLDYDRNVIALKFVYGN